jgi:hypothetical protein
MKTQSRARRISVLDYRHPYGVYVHKGQGTDRHLAYIVTCYDTDGNQVGSWNCQSDHDTASTYPALSAFVRDREKWLKRTHPDRRSLRNPRHESGPKRG